MNHPTRLMTEKKETTKTKNEMTFWEHLDELRGSLIKIAITVVVSSIVVFLFKEETFRIIFAPKNDSFITYEILNKISHGITGNTEKINFSVQLINTGLTEQFMTHMKTSIHIGFMISLPYILYLLFRFISPALYSNEKKYSARAITSGYVMFMLGVLLNYFLIFPLTLSFLGTYQVSQEVANMISLQSYMDILMMMNLMMGIVFELPILCWVLGKLGVLTDTFMKKFRKHSFVAILIVSAIITPTSDVFTLMVVALPIWILYEISILVVKASGRKNKTVGE